MYTISKSEFDQIVQEYYTPSPEDSPKVVAKYSYEAHRAAIEELILNTRENYYDRRMIARRTRTVPYEDEVNLTEPTYLFVTQLDDISTAYELSKTGLVHGLVVIDVWLPDVHHLMNQLVVNGPYRVTEFYYFVSSTIITRDYRHGSYDYRPAVINRITPNPIFDEMYIKAVGLYGNAVSAWYLGRMKELPIEWLTIGQLIPNDEYQLVDVEINNSDLKVLDIEMAMMEPIRLVVHNMSELLENAEWITLGHDYMERLNKLVVSPSMNTLCIPSSPGFLIVDGDLLELDIKFVGDLRPILELLHMDNLEILKLEYSSRVYLYPESMTPWVNLPNLTVLYLYGTSVMEYRDNFNLLENVVELKIEGSTSYRDDQPIPESIYDMPSLETLILSRVSLGTLEKLDLERFKNPVEIKIDRLLYNDDRDRLIEFIAEYDQRSGNENILMELTRALSGH